MKPRELEIFNRILDIVKTASKYGLKSGLNVHLVELEALKKAAKNEGNSADLEEIEFVYNFLKAEQDEAEQNHASRSRKCRYFKEILPIGSVVNVRHKLVGNIQAEVLGYLAEGVVVRCLSVNGKPIIEVNPYDLKT